MADPHQSDSTAQSEAEGLILALLGESLGVPLRQTEPGNSRRDGNRAA
jgi:hypothetical protein